jgi:hypothetical protein
VCALTTDRPLHGESLAPARRMSKAIGSVPMRVPLMRASLAVALAAIGPGTADHQDTPAAEAAEAAGGNAPARAQ